MDNSKQNKYHFAREIIFNLRSCHAINQGVYLHWIEKLIKEESELKNIVDLDHVSARKSKCQHLNVTNRICNKCKRVITYVPD